MSMFLVRVISSCVIILVLLMMLVWVGLFVMMRVSSGIVKLNRVVVRFLFVLFIS